MDVSTPPTDQELLTEPGGYFFEDLEVGMTAAYVATVSAADLDTFAVLSGDTNPVHLDERYAANTMFKGVIAHGMLCASFISTVLGTRLPGSGSVYVKQTLNFRQPVRPGDTVTARATVTELRPRRRCILGTTCMVGEIVVLDGEAEIMVPARP
ncbi:MAG: MaoC family dehydratase [Alphaproteobacteria bacterium]|nr:MaoC family dehydratase [Alphaproteobacteria bacterium]